MPKKHSIRRVVGACYDTPWAITPSKLEEIGDLLDRRAEGHLAEAEIEARLSALKIQYGGNDGQDGDPEKPYQVVDGVAVVRVYGVLTPRANLMTQYSGGTSYQQLAAAVAQAVEDDDVKAIVLDVDSPGGSVLGCEECAETIRIAAGSKPVVSVATGQMCSAAYWLGAAACTVVASPSSQVGSIGVYSIHTDYSAADTTSGIRRTVIQAGTEKTRGNCHETLDQAGREAMARTVGEYYQAFVAAVAVYRHTTVAQVEAGFGQGDSMKAPRAKTAGLVDRIATLSEIVGELADAKPVSPPTPTRSEATASLISSGVPTMNKKILEALQAMNLVGENPTEAEALASLRSYFAGRGQKVLAIDEAILAGLASRPAEPSPAPPPPAPAAAAAAPLPPAAPPSQQTAPDLAAVRAAERDRIQNIEARGKLLGVEETAILAAVDNGTSLADFLEQATASAVRREPGLAIQPTGSASETFLQAASASLALRVGAIAEKDLPSSARDIRHASLLEIAKESLRISGRRVVGDADQIACEALRGNGEAIVLAAGGYENMNSPGDFPNILSAAASKILAAGEPYAQTTYQNWAYRLPSVPDFKPTTILRLGEFGEMPLHTDGDVFEQSTFKEGYAWIQVDSYGDEIALTPRMIVDDNLGAFMEALTDKPAAHNATLNRLCVNLLVNNVVCADGTALYDASRGNVRAAGAAPSQTELSEIRKLFRAQTGLSGKRKLNYTVNRILVPFALETTSEALLAALQVVPASTTDVETFRRKVQWDVEPLLDDASSAVWYAFSGPGRAIAYTHQRGFESVRVRIFYDPRTNCRVLQFEGRFAAAVRNPQGTARNAGTGA